MRTELVSVLSKHRVHFVTASYCYYVLIWNNAHDIILFMRNKLYYTMCCKERSRLCNNELT